MSTQLDQLVSYLDRPGVTEVVLCVGKPIAMASTKGTLNVTSRPLGADQLATLVRGTPIEAMIADEDTGKDPIEMTLGVRAVAVKVKRLGDKLTVYLQLPENEKPKLSRTSTRNRTQRQKLPAMRPKTPTSKRNAAESLGLPTPQRVKRPSVQTIVETNRSRKRNDSDAPRDTKRKDIISGEIEKFEDHALAAPGDMELLARNAKTIRVDDDYLFDDADDAQPEPALAPSNHRPARAGTAPEDEIDLPSTEALDSLELELSPPDRQPTKTTPPPLAEAKELDAIDLAAPGSKSQAFDVVPAPSARPANSGTGKSLRIDVSDVAIAVPAPQPDLAPPERGTLSLDSLGLAADASKIVAHERGLVLIAASAGHGKSSTLSALVPLVDRTRVRDLVTLDQLRDRESVELALTAAESGYLVLATIEAASAREALDRLLDHYPGMTHARVKTRLVGALRGIVAKRLPPTPSELVQDVQLIRLLSE